MSIVKYPGGKERELPIINKFLPARINNYYEPFVGGGSVYMNMTANSYLINDFSEDLINLYRCIQQQDHEFFESLSEINTVWKNVDAYFESDLSQDDGLVSAYIKYKDGLIPSEDLEGVLINYFRDHEKSLRNIVRPLNVGDIYVFLEEAKRIMLKKMLRMKVLEFTKKHLPDKDISENIRGALKAAVYMYVRYLYNHSSHRSNGFKAMLYLFMRDMCYSGMFRFNADGEFNVPYGGISYNAKTYDSTIEKYKDAGLAAKMKNTIVSCRDYAEFMKQYPPEADDFVFVDPPYDSEFSTYDNAVFDCEAQKKLADYLINECPCNFMVDIKCTDVIRSIYPEGTICRNGNRLTIVYFDKKYNVSFMNRNDRDAQHMLVMNYKPQA